MAVAAIQAGGSYADTQSDLETGMQHALQQTPEDLSRYPLMRLLDEVRTLMAQRHAIDYRLMVLLRELDIREHLDGQPIYLARWLHEVFGLGYGAAREKVRTARALGRLPQIDAAFCEGKLSYSKARALTRVATDENETELLACASFASTDQIERLVKRYKQRERLDDVQAMLRQRSLTYYWDDDGMLVVNARLAPEQGALWLKALEKYLDDDLKDSPATAEAHPEPVDDYTARRADALTHALEAGLNGGERAGKPASAADRYQVIVHVSAETLCGQSAHDHGSRPGATPAIDDGPHLHPETVKRLTCDGALVSILENDEGEPLNVGRKTRVIHPSIRRALRARDERCQYPGCSHIRHLDGHHIVHWAHGGETKLANLVLLCRRHHRLVHEFGYTVCKTDGGFAFTAPSDA